MTTLTLYPTKDTCLEKQHPDSNKGAGDYLTLWDNSSAIWRAILEFALSDIPAGATISSATLRLYYWFYSNNDPVNKAVWAYKLTRTNWVELEATWNAYKTGSNWTTAGGDYVTSNPAGASTTFPSSYGWMEWNVLAIVQDAYANAIPAEFLVKFQYEIWTIDFSSYAVFHSKEYGSLIPELVIEYTTPAVELGAFYQQLSPLGFNVYRAGQVRGG